ncbi:MAG: hypothetical protein R3A78_03705 [Polyangiales bacterium]
MARELDDETLNQYFDGELPPEKRDLVRVVLDASEEERRHLARLERTRDFVRMAAEDQTVDLDSDALFAAISKGVKEQADAGYGEGFRVIEGGGRGDAARDSVRPVERWKISVPVGIALAVAAAAMLTFAVRRAPEQTTTDVRPTTSTEIEGPIGSEVEQVDFGSNTGTVFAVKGASGEPVAVVWLSDESTEEL